MNSIIIPAVRLSQIAATTGADLTNYDVDKTVKEIFKIIKS